MAVTFFGNVRTGRKEGCLVPSSWVRVPLNGWGKGEGDGGAAEKGRGRFRDGPHDRSWLHEEGSLGGEQMDLEKVHLFQAEELSAVKNSGWEGRESKSECGTL